MLTWHGDIILSRKVVITIALGGRRYNTNASLTAPNSSTAPIMFLVGGTAVRPAIYDIVTGNGVASPADNSVKLQIVRTTGVSSGGTAITPNPLDSQDPASTTTAAGGSFQSGNPTIGVTLLQWAQNMRATFRWVAAPNSELLVPATASNGIGMLNPAIGGSAFAVDWTVLFYE